MAHTFFRGQSISECTPVLVGRIGRAKNTSWTMKRPSGLNQLQPPGRNQSSRSRKPNEKLPTVPKLSSELSIGVAVANSMGLPILVQEFLSIGYQF